MGCQGQLENALIHQIEGFKIRSELLGESHPLTARSVRNIANTLRDLKHFEEALLFYEKAEKDLRNAYGVENLLVMKCKEEIRKIGKDLCEKKETLVKEKRVVLNM